MCKVQLWFATSQECNGVERTIKCETIMKIVVKRHFVQPLLFNLAFSH